MIEPDCADRVPTDCDSCMPNPDETDPVEVKDTMAPAEIVLAAVYTEARFCAKDATTVNTFPADLAQRRRESRLQTREIPNSVPDYGLER
jgi:hypothetical protein